MRALAAAAVGDDLEAAGKEHAAQRRERGAYDPPLERTSEQRARP
jgi:hypothetical protein